MKNVCFELPCKITAVLSSNKDLVIDGNTKLLAQAYLPGVKFLSKRPNKIDIIIIHVESAKRKMFRKGNKIIIQDIWHNNLPLDVYHLLYAALRVQLLKKQLFSVHAACVGNYLVVGHTSVGKTAISLGLVQKGMKLFSGNKTAVSFGNTLKAIAGTKTITIKTKDNKNSKFTKYQNRSAFLLDKKQYDNSKAIKINAIILVRLNDGVKEFTKLTNLSALHTLYPYFMDTINADVIINNKVFIGTPPKGSQELLARKLSKTLKRTPVYSITGSKQFIINKITNL